MKINWGWGITIFYIIFVISLLFQLYKSTTYDNSLVEKDYYAKDLAYQEHYEKLVNAQSLSKDVQIMNLPQKEGVNIYFPEHLSGLEGEILFFSPQFSHLDFKVPVQVDVNNQQFIDASALQKGKWKVKVDWQAEGKAFFKEEIVVL
ncbi:MAG: FixH family protein [Bacteroidota bacterium]